MSNTSSMSPLHITDLEAAINWWRLKRPSPDGVTLPRELRSLAEVARWTLCQRSMRAGSQDFAFASAR